MIAPWEIAELHEQAPEWIWTAQEVVRYRQGQRKNQQAAAWQAQIYERWRNSHPAYIRKH